jgi:hypothetical protein
MSTWMLDVTTLSVMTAVASFIWAMVFRARMLSAQEDRDWWRKEFRKATGEFPYDDRSH